MIVAYSRKGIFIATSLIGLMSSLPWIAKAQNDFPTKHELPEAPAVCGPVSSTAFATVTSCFTA